MNFEKILNNLKNVDKKIIKVMKNGIKISFIICIIASFILSVYNINNNPSIYYIGISIFKSGLFYIATIIMCGIAFNKIGTD